MLTTQSEPPATAARVIWTKLALALTCLFVATSIWVIVWANPSAMSPVGHADVIAKLDGLEHALLDLAEGSILIGRSAAVSNVPERWRELYGNYRNQASQLDGKDPKVQEVRDSLLRIDAEVGRTEQIRRQLLDPTLADQEARALEAEFRSKISLALAEVREGKQRLSNRSVEDLRDKLSIWNIYFVVACLLGVALGAVLVAYDRKFARAVRTAKALEEKTGALREMEGRMQALLAAAPDAVLVLDESGIVRAAGASAERMFGYSAEEWRGLGLSIFLPTVSRRGGQALVGEAPREVRRTEAPARRKDGSEFPAEIVASRDRTLIVVFLRDVTARRQADEALRKERDFLAAVVNAADALVVVVDLQGRITWINRACQEKTGFISADIRGKLFSELLPIATGEGAPELRRAGAFPGRTGAGWVTREGQRRLISWHSADLMDAAGKLEQVALVGIDITHLAATERKATEQVGMLAAKIAQTFSNLLTRISGYSELVLHSLESNDPLRKDIGQIKDAGEQAALLTNELLAFSQKQVLRSEIVDVNAVLEGMESRLRRWVGPDIELKVDKAAEHGLVRADAEQLERVIVNLVTNAREAMPRGGCLSIRTADTEPDPDGAFQVLIAVGDTGCGMSQEIQARIFEPFFTTKDPGKSMGLGLSTAYGVIRRSGGSIRVSSEPGRGATFRIYLPAVEASGKTTPSPVMSGIPPAGNADPADRPAPQA